MTDKETIEQIIRDIANSFSGEQSTKNWTKETIWFDAAPYACIGAEKARVVFDEAFGNLQSCKVEIIDIRTRIKNDTALVCSV